MLLPGPRNSASRGRGRAAGAREWCAALSSGRLTHLHASVGRAPLIQQKGRLKYGKEQSFGRWGFRSDRLGWAWWKRGIVGASSNNSSCLLLPARVALGRALVSCSRSCTFSSRSFSLRSTDFGGSSPDRTRKTRDSTASSPRALPSNRFSRSSFTHEVS
jgi:hypothetical protein